MVEDYVEVGVLYLAPDSRALSFSDRNWIIFVPNTKIQFVKTGGGARGVWEAKPSLGLRKKNLKSFYAFLIF